MHASNVDCSFLNPNGRNLARKQQNSDPIRPPDPASQRNNRKEEENSNGDTNGSLDSYRLHLPILSEMERHGRCDKVLQRAFEDFLSEPIPEEDTMQRKEHKEIERCILHLSAKACNSISLPQHHTPEREDTIQLQSQTGIQIHICQLLNIEGSK